MTNDYLARRGAQIYMECWESFRQSVDLFATIPNRHVTAVSKCLHRAKNQITVHKLIVRKLGILELLQE